MTLRPVSASWFELLTSREELGATLDCLAATGSVQLEAYSRSEQRLALPDLRTTLADYETLARRYGHYWPRAADVRHAPEHDLLDAPRRGARSRADVDQGGRPADRRTRGTLRRPPKTPRCSRSCWPSPATAWPASTRWPGPARCSPDAPTCCPRAARRRRCRPTCCMQRVTLDARLFLLAVGPTDEITALDQALAARKARVIPLPDDLPADPVELGRHLEARRAAIAERQQAARAALDALSGQQGIAAALGELALAAWLVTHVPELPVTEHFAWVTGWCADADDTQLRAALDARNLHYLLRFTPAPADAVAPSVLRNPAWARPFEVFGRLMGVPGTREADPSMVLALVAPLMFGYMFGDVVQGLVLAIIGFVVRDRLPALRLLVPGGLVAVAFGFAFGSVFAREDVIPALWVHPLSEPLTVLGTALGFGVVVILVGLLLNALQYHWRGELGKLGRDRRRAAGGLPGHRGQPWSMRGCCGRCPPASPGCWPAAHSWRPATASARVGRAAGESLERLLQLGVNTVSFVRVGAFALAHAGLSTAVVGIADAAGPAYWPVLLIGNAAIIALEGLVVGIQTTRLMLFEFFIRFLAAHGRPFEPLPPPSPMSEPLPRSKP